MIALNTVVYNEAHRIVGCLESAAQLCDEFVVVDQDSTDGTAGVAEEWGASVFFDKNYGYCEASRPLAQFVTKSDWILVLDADEELMLAVVPMLREMVQQNDRPIALGTRHYIEGKAQFDAEQFPCRLFKKGTVDIGTTLHSRITPLEGEPRQVPGAILHAKSQAEWQLDHDRYVRLTCP